MRILSILIIGIMNASYLTAQPLQTVPHVDLDRYAGKWYEIASYPQRFQKGCHCTVVEYTVTNKDYILVHNRCNKGSINGKLAQIKGKAFVEKKSGNAKLKIQFIWPLTGQYWIIDLADDYSFAVVSHPHKKYLWILSRTSKMNDVTYNNITRRLSEKGFDIKKLRATKQM